MDQRALVERAKRGDHDAFVALIDAVARAPGRGRLAHPPGRGARARRGPGCDGASLAGPARVARPGPVRTLAPPTHRECLHRPGAASASAGHRGGADSPRSIRPSPTSPRSSPTETSSTARSPGSSRSSAPSSSFASSSSSRCRRRRGARHPPRDRQVPPPSVARADAHQRRRPTTTSTPAASAEGRLRMTPTDRPRTFSPGQLTDGPRRPRGDAAGPTTETTSSGGSPARAAAARLDLHRKVAPHVAHHRHCPRPRRRCARPGCCSSPAS